MSLNGEGFDALVEGLFTDDELDDLGHLGLETYKVEPVTPCRSELLELFDAVANTLRCSQVGGGKKLMRMRMNAAFANRLIPNLSIHLNQEMVVISAQSLCTKGALFVLDGSIQEVKGDFAGMQVAPWYDLPCTEEALMRHTEFKQDDGLHVVLEGARLMNSISGEVEMLLGHAAVSLNHGQPELYQKLSPSN